MNKVVVSGYLAKDSELKVLEKTHILNIVVGVNDGYGEHKKTYFLNATMFGKDLSKIAECTPKGTHVALSGKMITRTYDNKEGVKQYVTQIEIDNYGGLELLGKPKKEESHLDNVPSDYGDMPF